MTTWEEEARIEGIEREGTQRALRRILRLTERHIDRRGQVFIVPELVLVGWTTSLPQTFTPQATIALYADHGTHEQFHSEFKSDLDLTRLPSGKFDTNYLVCQLAALAMNVLRLMGQRGLLGPDAPVRHAAKRRRIKTVMQELIYRAGRLIEHGRQLVLGLGLGATDHRSPSFGTGGGRYPGTLGLGEDDILVAVVPRPEKVVVPREIIDWCRSRLAQHQVPRYIAVVDSLPHTPTHRVAKFKLREDPTLQQNAVDLFGG